MIWNYQAWVLPSELLPMKHLSLVQDSGHLQELRLPSFPVKMCVLTIDKRHHRLL